MIAAPGLQSTGSIVVMPGLSCYTACGTFPDQRWRPYLVYQQVDSSPLSHQGTPHLWLLDCMFGIVLSRGEKLDQVNT